jgi:hypothetical protein
MESSVLNLVATLVTDIALLLIMFVGLIRLRLQGGLRFGLIQLLWKQVWSWCFASRGSFVVDMIFLARVSFGS